MYFVILTDIICDSEFVWVSNSFNSSDIVYNEGSFIFYENKCKYISNCVK